MSHYRKIKVEIKNGKSAVEALRRLGYTPVAAQDLTQNDTVLLNRFGEYFGNSRVSIAVQPDNSKYFNGFGFAWNGEGYDLIHDGMPTSDVNKIIQGYAVVEATRLATANGYTVQEVANPDGTIQLICNSYGTGGY